MKGLQKSIHGLKVKIGLKRSWLNMLKRKNPKRSYEYVESQISQFETKLQKLTLLLNCEKDNSGKKEAANSGKPM